MRAERRRIGRDWRRLRRHGLRELQGRTVDEYRRYEQRMVEHYSVFPQRFILGVEPQQMTQFEKRWVAGENPGARFSVTRLPAQLRVALAQLDALAEMEGVLHLREIGVLYEQRASTDLSPRAGTRRQLLEHGRAPKGRR